MPTSISNLNLNYDRPIQIAAGTYWIGFYDEESGLRCNPYLIIDGQEAVVIDGGSRPDFPVVMMKILQSGLNPSAIRALIYHHYDPDLCGSIANFEDLIDRPDLMVISGEENKMFIRHYAAASQLYDLNTIGNEFRFSSGRRLQFFNTPYAHSGGSFITLDSDSGVLFTSDIFGSCEEEWQLFLEMEPACRDCRDYARCPQAPKICPVPGILNFHCQIMPSMRALRYAVQTIAAIPFKLIAPQHGSIIPNIETAGIIMEKLVALEKVGIDGVIADPCLAKIGDISPLFERLK